MFKLSGQLNLTRYKTKKGSFFSVGELIAEEGIFQVKGSAFDQFQEGIFEGTFIVARIRLESKLYKGRLFSNIVADLEQFDMQPISCVSEGLEVDRAIHSTVSTEDEEADSSTPSEPSSDNSDAREAFILHLNEVFGTANGVVDQFDLKQRIKFEFDSTSDQEKRKTFFKVTKFLNDNGYLFDDRQQAWFYRP